MLSAKLDAFRVVKAIVKELFQVVRMNLRDFRNIHQESLVQLFSVYMISICILKLIFIFRLVHLISNYKITFKKQAC